MNVWFDHQIFTVQRYGGYSRYFLSLARALRSQVRCRPLIVAPAHLSEMIRADDPLHRATFRLRRPLAGARWRPWLLAPLFRLLAQAQRPDVVHETHHILGGGHVPRSARLVSTCHDMIPETLCDGSAAARTVIERKRRALERSDRIICVSASTQAELDRIYPRLASRSVVVHHGVDLPPAPGRMPPALPERYVLFVGVRQGYKNFALALRALAASSAFCDGVQLVCFGGGSLRPAEVALIASCGIDAAAVHCIAGDDALLSYCYRHAVCLLFPSCHEGFGMPLTEAMVHGCPVACSDIPCFREICDDAAAFFDPSSLDSMRHVLQSVIDSTATRRELGARGRHRALAFSWDRCAEATMACYRS